MTFELRISRIFAIASLLAASTAAGAASQYYFTITGSPSAIACANDSYSFGSGATASWNFVSSGSTLTVDGSLYINNVLTASTTQTVPAPSGSQPLSGGNQYPYTSTPYPYTLNYVVVPRDPDTDGVTVSWTCTANGGTNFKVVTLPAPAPALAGSPAQLNFPSTNVGATTAPMVATITNNGNAEAKNVTASTSSADFAVSATTCGATLAVGASCTASVTFSPTAAGVRVATLTVAGTNGTGASVTVRGTGNTQLTIQPQVAFPGQTVGTTSAAIDVVVTNTGAAEVMVGSVTSSNGAEFPITTTCTTVGAGATCTISIRFKPSDVGLRTGTVTVTSNGVGSPQTISVSGQGTAPAGPGQLSLPATVTFATQAVGTTSAVKTLTVTNVGTSPVTVSGIVSSAPTEFAVTPQNCATLAAGASCTIDVTFKPAAAGARAATITVTSTGTGSPQTIAASGTGGAGPAPGQLSVPAGLGFGDQATGTTSAPILVNLTNVGGSPVTVTSIVSSAPAEFAAPGASCAPLNPGAQCLFSVTFTPAATGARAATITITSNGVGSPQTINLTGNGVGTAPPTGQLSMNAELAFGSVQVGGSASATVYLTNVGAAPVLVQGFASDNSLDFAITQWDCTTVPVQGTCSFRLTFTPSAVGARSATITVTSNGIGSPQTLVATGTGTATPPPPPATIEVIEYYHAEWDHYFITAIADEIAKLDNGVFKGWARTGYKFKAYAPNTAGAANVCRFFSTSFGERSSHFYTPFVGECSDVKKNPNWMIESEAVFAIPVPDIHGVCPAGTVAVYRYYNQGQGGAPNHRYAVDFSLRNDMIVLRGWIPEGYGDLGVIMCAPP
ncbi:MAG: choice-of-anchor D domain-containing protein [Burkholderiales bacterium]